MQLLTTTQDNKITAKNHLTEMTIGEYAEIAKQILDNNDLQRRRVKTANRSYSLLKEDIKIGCVIPPIVLAIFPKKDNESVDIDADNLKSIIGKFGKDLLILDGLQRTYTILDLLDEVKGMEEILLKVNNLPLRVEIYTGISKVGVLYRMLTLNTGQTPMSTRHQIEMIYSDYKKGVDDLVFISEAEGKVPSGNKEFKFSDVLDGFLSYIKGDFLPIDREDLVATIKNLETLTKDDKQKDLFKLFINSYDNLRAKLNELGDNWDYNTDEQHPQVLVKKPFATNVNELFSKVQFMAGYGAALSFLIQQNLIVDFEDLNEKINSLQADEEFISSLSQMIKYLDEIQINAKKIGNEQRMYFYYLLRSLFNSSNEGYLQFPKSVYQGYMFYKANALG